MEQRNWPRDHAELARGPIQLRIPTVDRIFNPMDPSPLEIRSLDPEAADWIEEWAEDLDNNRPITLEVIVADQRLDGREDAITSAVHAHFAYREWQAGRQLAKLMREGRLSLLIGVVALTAFSLLARLIGESDHTAVQVAHESALVLGWVSMWKPMGIFLHEWWPIRRERRALRRLAESTVVFPLAPTRR
ncbi:MAG: hypothetical protein RI900_3213 [Actinomycetota bacterium]|jgi:hypothetical protein